jgi:hypothetical protein
MCYCQIIESNGGLTKSCSQKTICSYKLSREIIVFYKNDTYRCSKNYILSLDQLFSLNKNKGMTI